MQTETLSKQFRGSSGITGLLSLSFVLQYQTGLVLLSAVALHHGLHGITDCSAFLAGLFFFSLYPLLFSSMFVCQLFLFSDRLLRVIYSIMLCTFQV